jgi:hypothetical protein
VKDAKGLLKWPLIVAAILIVLRVGLEQIGTPETVNNIFGVAWLYFIVPFYFAVGVAKSGEPKPYKLLFKKLLLFGVYTRLMVMPTYWLAYALQWEAPRFSLALGGVVGDGVTPLQGYLWYPVRNAIVWILFAVVVGMIFGGVTLLVLRRKSASAETTEQ